VKQIDTIIWDWNGTLLDDVHISLSSVNQLLAEKNLEILTHERYLDLFTFPVQKYYESIGFDFDSEPFEITAHRFIEIYNESARDFGLYSEVMPVLECLKAKGLKQFILSAMEQQLLEETVRQNNIFTYFDAVYGLNHQYATSKIEIGINLITQNNLSPCQTLLIGDTIHDFEVAQFIGCQCILVAKGHQSRKRLESTGAKVIDNLSELRI
jgi:phosphoglycolate phosphatase